MLVTFFLNVHSLMLHWHLKLDHGKSIYTSEISNSVGGFLDYLDLRNYGEMLK